MYPLLYMLDKFIMVLLRPDARFVTNRLDKIVGRLVSRLFARWMETATSFKWHAHAIDDVTTRWLYSEGLLLRKLAVCTISLTITLTLYTVVHAAIMLLIESSGNVCFSLSPVLLMYYVQEEKCWRLEDRNRFRTRARTPQCWVIKIICEVH